MPDGLGQQVAWLKLEGDAVVTCQGGAVVVDVLSLLFLVEEVSPRVVLVSDTDHHSLAAAPELDEMIVCRAL